MELNQYQRKARETAMYQDAHRIHYPVLGLASEAGEACGVVKRAFRDHDARIPVELQNKLLLELGDCLWYIANAAADLGVDLSTVAQMNLDKLNRRMDRGTIKGEGDER